MMGGRKNDDATYQQNQQHLQSGSHQSVVIIHLQIININIEPSCLSFEVPQLRVLVVALAVTHSRKYKLDIYIIIKLVVLVLLFGFFADLLMCANDILPNVVIQLQPKIMRDTKKVHWIWCISKNPGCVPPH
jgi:hypothetical protein